MNVALELDYTSIVVVGAWNPSIIQPFWLFEHNVVPRQEDLPEMGFQPLGRSVKLHLSGLDWTIEETRLEIRSSEGKDCATYAATILDLLPHTPIYAIGDNFVFRCKSSEWPAEHRPRFGRLMVRPDAEHSAVRKVACTLVREIDPETTLGVQLTEEHEHVVISFNFHRNCQQATRAAQFAGQWAKDRDAAIQALGELFEVRFTWPN